MSGSPRDHKHSSPDHQAAIKTAGSPTETADGVSTGVNTRRGFEPRAAITVSYLALSRALAVRRCVGMLSFSHQVCLFSLWDKCALKYGTEECVFGFLRRYVFSLGYAVSGINYNRYLSFGVFGHISLKPGVRGLSTLNSSRLNNRWYVIAIVGIKRISLVLNTSMLSKCI